jgi:hypothetical protein
LPFRVLLIWCFLLWEGILTPSVPAVLNRRVPSNLAGHMFFTSLSGTLH